MAPRRHRLARNFMWTDIIQPMLLDGKDFRTAARYKNSKRYDTGDKLEYIKTVYRFCPGYTWVC